MQPIFELDYLVGLMSTAVIDRSIDLFLAVRPLPFLLDKGRHIGLVWRLSFHSGWSAITRIDWFITLDLAYVCRPLALNLHAQVNSIRFRN